MPNGHTGKDYGNHKYADYDGISDCEYNCGCWMGSSCSGGLLGLDPFGKCPNNPVGGVRQEGNRDYNDVVEKRIEDLGQRAYKAEQAFKAVDQPRKRLAREIRSLKEKLNRAERIIGAIRQALKTK